MKNIHLLPTEKARLYIHQGKLYDNKKTMHIPDGTQIPQHIYITNDEEIKVVEYGIDIRDSKVFKCERTLSNHYEFGVLQFQKSYCKKIILTTDQDLIKDGVQAIDDNFLQWFVKNPSCERIVFEKIQYNPVFDEDDLSYDGMTAYYNYKIIIPQEEPKQEIVINEKCSKCGSSQYQIGKPFCTDEFCNTNIGKASEDYWLKQPYNEDAFVEGAKWQAERMYSEEDLISFAHFYFTEEFNSSMQTSKSTKDIFTEWFTQFKKK